MWVCFKVDSDDVWDDGFPPSIKLLKDMKKCALRITCNLFHSIAQCWMGIKTWEGCINGRWTNIIIHHHHWRYYWRLLYYTDFFVKMIMYRGSNKTFIMHFYHPHYTIPYHTHQAVCFVLFCVHLRCWCQLFFDVMCCANRKDRADWERKSLKFKQKFVGNQ